MNCSLDKIRSIIIPVDPDSRRKPCFDLFDFGFHAFDDRQGVFTVAHQDDPAHGLLTIFNQGPAAKLRTQSDNSNVLHIDRNAFVRPNDNVLYIFRGLDKPQTSNDPLCTTFFYNLGTYIDIAFFDSPDELFHVDSIGKHLVGINIDLVLFDIASNTGHFTHTPHGCELEFNKPVLY